MPRGDRTGPNGMGPMTGRAAGFCAGSDRPGYAAGGAGGFGYGRGGGGYGRGFRHRFNATGVPFRQGFGGWGAAPYPAAPVQYTLEQELDMRRREVDLMEAELKAAKDHIAKLEKDAE